MLKALFKKQFMEVNASWFMNKKTGKAKSKKGVVTSILLFVLLMVILGISFGVMFYEMGKLMIPLGLGWFYFTIMILLSILLGVFGSVFNTYAGLYKSKDNEFLLSLPIPPIKILISRLLVVYALSLLYEGMVLIPAIVVYWMVRTITFWTILCPILIFFGTGLLVSALTCLLGWFVAWISSKIRNRSFITVILSLTVMILYYVVYFKIVGSLEDIIKNIETIGQSVRNASDVLYWIGQAMMGHVGAFAIYMLCCCFAMGITVYLMARNFIRLATTDRGEKKVAYNRKAEMQCKSIGSALFRKEMKRFTGSATYMLNTGIGALLGLVVLIFAIIKHEALTEMLALIEIAMPAFAPMIPIIVPLMVAMLLGMDCVTAPSVSLEGKNIWILQTLPVDSWEVLKAKLKVHLAINELPVIVVMIGLGLLCRLEPAMILLGTVFGALYVLFVGTAGLALNLKYPNLTWTNEIAPIKQSIVIVIIMFGGWALCAAIGFGFYFLMDLISGWLFLLLVSLVLAVLIALILGWLRKKGTLIFDRL